MLKSFAIGACLVLLSACASQPTSPNKATTAAAKKPPAGCVAQTATRIPVKDDACAGFGNTYTKQDVDDTGQVFLDRALPMLDPAITRH